MRKALLVLLATVLAVLALPAASANATPPKGDFASCYKIIKSGRYNDVAAGARVTQSAGKLRVHGFVAVSKACQKTNSIPIHSVTILHSRLRNSATNKIVKLSGSHTSYKSGIARSTTAPNYTHCHVNYQASIEISFSYTDGSHVRPFWIHGKKFTRC